ncbi:MAG: alpha-galactosidase [Planctomycetota bacterium]
MLRRLPAVATLLAAGICAQSAPRLTQPVADYLISTDLPPAVAREERAELHLENGLVRRTFRLAPNGATVALSNLRTGESLLRAVRPEAAVTIDGVRYEVGGLQGQPNHAFLRPEWIDKLVSSPEALRYVGHRVGEPAERMPWARVRHHAPGASWPPPGVHLRMDYATKRLPGVVVRVHYELYDGVPVFSKWLDVVNGGGEPIRIDDFEAEILAVVEQESWVETRDGVPYPVPQSLHVEADYSFGGMTPQNASRRAVHWLPDPDYSSQVNYRRVTPCLLVASPELGPGQVVAPGETFESFRVFELLHDSSDRERRGLALRRMYRTIAPWITENPLMHHMRISDPGEVRRAIDQAAEVGFEMLILSFGSGFNIESEDPAYVESWKEIADYAREHGVEIGGYSLLASRSISAEDDVVMPEGQRPTFNNSPCLGSTWGERYFAKLYAFFEATGFALLEHDGNYPGDECLSEAHPGHAGHADSRWSQWRAITDFYRWCRGRGVYLNVPDYYYTAGSSKCGMGYREVNWSLPRAEQVIHTRMNIYDGTWTKTPSMGWMFVPLTEYHGGGAAATIEPLDEHRDHYESMLRSNLALGVQACFRGPRLFDTDATRELVRGQVEWFKRYREVLESDVVHGRRPDGRDVDWMLHVNPFASEGQPRGMLVAFNPLAEAAARTIDVDLYYAGLSGSATVEVDGGAPVQRELRGTRLDVEVEIPAGGMAWVAFR